MADGRGGYQEPPPNASPGGVGKSSKRSDGGSLKQGPKLSDRGVKSGDVAAIEQRMASRPPQGQNGPNLGQSGPGQGGGAMPPNVPLAEMQGGGLPPQMFGPSVRPGEPTTTGLGAGAGPGTEALNAPPGQEDFRTWKLRQLATTFGNQDAIELLMDIEDKQLQRDRAAMPAPMPTAAAPDAPIEEGEDELDMAAFEEEEMIEDEDYEEPEDMDEFGEPVAEGEEEMLMAEEEAALADEESAAEPAETTTE